ncbi:unnamed protein product [Durusdinium trenchii]|uniref:Uncharacterized protein n=1 Tax=Durusdinium trenchii TaxID=1381693 RepID=A0ABP0IZ07_9DINO
MKWCEQQGGHPDSQDHVSRIARLGASGKFPGSVERDMHTFLKGLNQRLGAKISTIRARMYNHTAAREEWQPMEILYPDDLASALFSRSKEAFIKCMFADVDADRFWNHCAAHCEWFKQHSLNTYPRRDRLIPFSLYGDDVQCYRNSEVGTVSIIAWTSDFAYGNTSLCRYFPIAVYSEHCSTENTHDDIMKCVMARLKQMCSCEHLFDWSADGFCFMFSSVQGDLKWIFDRYGLHNFHANACCSLCGAVKNHANLSMTIADFRPTAAHINSEPDLSGFLARNSSVFQLATRDRVLHDVMHGQLLGTGKVLNGSVLVYMCESGVFGDFQPGGAGIYEQCLESVLRAAHCDFLRFKKERGIQTVQPRFTPSRCSRKTRMQYPVLSSKAAASKAVTMWLANRACSFALRDGASEMDRLVCTCVQTYAMALNIMDDCGLVMTAGESGAFYDAIMTHLQTFALLNKRSRQLTGRVIGRNMFILLPKHHHLMHAAQRTKLERINPRSWSLFSGEDFIGRIGRIARVCHRSTVSFRVLERYLALMYLELAKLIP